MSEVKTYSADELKEILRLHAEWRAGRKGGERADLRDANLRDAYLGGAYLGGAYLGGAYLGGADLRGAYLRGADLGGAYLGGAYLGGADLRGADLRDANLRDAYLGGAYLGGAYLRGADLGGAYLGGAYLGGAYLGGAYLGGAYLRGADLRGADLRGAYLRDDTTLWTGETWRAYLDTVLPQLCVAGGQPLAAVVAAWDCHEWDNCPMHAAFGIQGTDDLSGLPLLLKPRIEQFVQLFDAGLIPKAEIEKHLTNVESTP